MSQQVEGGVERGSDMAVSKSLFSTFPTPLDMAGGGVRLGHRDFNGRVQTLHPPHFLFHFPKMKVECD